tara:strand:- start:853 stop:1533 length:681 start_codon:yes stop_codon:yes gene_type:complete
MDRIRKYNNNYQVLITPNQKYNVGFEFVIGSWSDESLKGFKVISCKTLNEAINISYNLPNINWTQLINYHEDNFEKLHSLLSKILQYSRTNAFLEAYFMDEDKLKNTFMNRVIKYQKDDKFRLVNHMNDIIQFIISANNTKQLNYILHILLNDYDLKIFKSYEKNSVIHLIGRTDISTTYEIILIPTLINKWMKSVKLNKNTNIHDSLKHVINLQNKIDSKYINDE